MQGFDRMTYPFGPLPPAPSGALDTRPRKRILRYMNSRTSPLTVAPKMVSVPDSLSDFRLRTELRQVRQPASAFGH
jgi:hypothetical protein